MITIYQLKVELAGSLPKIWRRLTVPSDTPFDHLHDILQIAMGWEDEYEFEFIINETRVRDFGHEIDMGDNPYDKDAMDTFLDELVTMSKTRFTYIYNLDGGWEHHITLEKILSAGEAPAHPYCMAGENPCPPNVLFDIEDVNAMLKNYSDEWDEIYSGTEEDIEDLDDENDIAGFDERRPSEYERVKHLKSPQDLLNDELERQGMEDWVDDALADESSAEYNTFRRLVNQGHSEDESRTMIFEALSIEFFYDLKYGTGHFNDRYQYNLDRLPEIRPVEIPSLDFAVEVLDKCTKGIPFSAIDYLHNDTSTESTSAIVKALNNFSDRQYPWADCVAAPIWYSFAAEGHICEQLIDPVVGLYCKDNEHATDWIHDQGQYLIGKLAQKYPEITAQKVLAAMEKNAADGDGGYVYYLFDAFDFCAIDKYKDRLIALLKRDDIPWHDMLATTIAHLQIKEGLPVLKEQVKQLEAKKTDKHPNNGHIIEIKEAIRELESGEALYPDLDSTSPAEISSASLFHTRLVYARQTRQYHFRHPGLQYLPPFPSISHPIRQNNSLSWR